MSYEIEYKTKPYEHQEIAIKTLVDALENRALNYHALFMEMGTGKTKVTIDYATYLSKYKGLEAVLVIAPNGVQEQWYKEQIDLHCPLNTRKFLWQNAKSSSYLRNLDEFINEDGKYYEEYVKKESKPKATTKNSISESPFSSVISDTEKGALDDLFSDLDGTAKVEKEIPEEDTYDMPGMDDIPFVPKQEIALSSPGYGMTMMSVQGTVTGRTEIPCSIEEVPKGIPTGKILKWFCVNVERFSVGDSDTFKPFIDFIKNHNTLIVIDEGTVVKNPDAKRTKNIGKLAKGAEHKLLLTGTPVTNSPFDVFSMMEILRPGFWGCNYFVFKNRYGMFVKDSSMGSGRVFSREMNIKDISVIKSMISKGEESDDIAAKIGTTFKSVEYIRENPDVTRPYKNLDQIKQAILPVSIVIKKSDCKDIRIPDKIYTTVELNMSDDQYKVYHELRKNLLAEYQNKELTVLNKVALTTRLQQITGGFFPTNPLIETVEPLSEEEQLNNKMIPIGSKNPKIEFLKQDLSEAGDLKVIIWARFVAEIKAIETALTKFFPNKIVATYYGGTPMSKRNEIKEAFGRGEIDIIIINPQTGSRGLNFQISTLHYFFSNHRSLDYREQAEDRSHRIGQTKNVQYKDIIMKGTIDQTIINGLKQNKDMLEYFRDRPLRDLI